MRQAIGELQVTVVGFARSLVWAIGIACIAAIIAVSSLVPRHWPTLSICVMCAAALYPMVCEQRSRHALRGGVLALLLLGPTLDIAHRPWVSMLASAAVIGALRSWPFWKGGTKGFLWRELCCAGASVVLGASLFASSPSGLVFGIWGFCLGQLVATLFGEAPE